ncbi:MAG TPA: SAM-dependent methyltransferase [Patescibacteria group bacterium]|nr:SAM-dependent methyltransferase [Patescibacteria group bacterium]
MIWPPDSPWAPWWRTSDEKIRKAFKLADLRDSDVVYDLGSGDGRSVIIAAKEFGARGIGVEIDPLRFYLSKLFAKFNGVSHKTKFIKKSFFDVDISDATVIFVYLVPKTLEKLKPKFLKELKRGTRIISINYESTLSKQNAIEVDRKKITLYKI